ELWRSNPAMPQSARWPIGWVLQEGGRIVGAIGNIPAAYYLGSRRLSAAMACDWAVDPPYRTHSLALLQRLSRQRGVDLLLCTAVSPQSEPGFRPLGWSRVPAGRWDSVAFWITNHRSFARVVLRTKHIPAAGILRYPLAAGLFCCDRLKSM